MFKRCSMCGKSWETKEEFLHDGTLHFDGHFGHRKRVVTGQVGDGLLIFTHLIDDCGTTLAVPLSRFRSSML